MTVKPIPDDTSSVIPYLVVPDVKAQIEFLQKAFDARLRYQHGTPDGTIMHAHLRIGNSCVMMGQMPPGKSPVTAMLYMYVTDVDAVYQRALDAGGTSICPVSDQYYGDRVGAVKDAAGNEWYIATHKEDVSDDEIARRAKAQHKH